MSKKQRYLVTPSEVTIGQGQDRGSTQSLYEYFHETTNVAPYFGASSVAARSMTFGILRHSGNVKIVPFCSDIANLCPEISARPILSSYVQTFRDAAKNPLRSSEGEDEQLIRGFKAAIQQEWDLMYTDQSESDYEMRWMPQWRILWKARFKNRAVGALQIIEMRDRQDLLLPVDMCIFRQRPKPDLAMYVSAPNLFQSNRGHALPIFHVGGKGPNGGIDAAVPQDVTVSYAAVMSWIAVGMKVDEIVIFHAAVGSGMATQFFMTYVSDPTDVAVPSPTERSQPSSASSSKTSLAGSRSSSKRFISKSAEVEQSSEGFGYQPEVDEDEAPALKKYRKITTVAVTPKLDPARDSDAYTIAKCFLVCIDHAHGMVKSLDKALSRGITNNMKAAAEPKPNDWDSDDEDTEVNVGNYATTSTETLVAPDEVVDPEMLQKRIRAAEIGRSWEGWLS